MRVLPAGAAAFLIFFAGHYAVAPALSIDRDHHLATLGSGFHTFEQNAQRRFVWTTSRATLSMDGLDRRIEWRLTGRVNAWRPSGSRVPTLRITLDNTEVLTTVPQGEFNIDVVLPVRDSASGATIVIDVMPPFVPGGGDTRALGVAIDSLTLAPVRTPLPPAMAAAAGAAAILVLAAPLAALPMSRPMMYGITLVAAWCLAWLMTRGVAPYSRFPMHMFWLAAALGAGALALGRLIERRRGARLTATATLVLTLSATACWLKLGVLLHPAMPIGDGLFHAHRLGYVLSGRLYFTSIAPGDFAFPYPVLLYVAAAPFAAFVTDTFSRVALLRIVTTVADAIAGALIYWMIARTLARPQVAGERRASGESIGVAAVVWYHLVPMTAWIMTWGNLTNAFGQSLFVATLAVLIGLPVRLDNRASVMAGSALATAACLSHPSTFAILVATLGATTALYFVRGGEALKHIAGGMTVATLFSALAATVLYYAWFPAVYARELGRIASETGARLGAPGAPIESRLAMVPVLAQRYFGWPALVAACGGVWQLARSSERSLTLLIAGWLGICLIFLVVGVLTPMELRYHFAAFPALAIAAGVASERVARQGWIARFAGLVIVSAAAWLGVRQWIWVLSW